MLPRMVPMSTGTVHTRVKPLSVRRNVNRKTLVFSLSIGVVATLLVAFVYFLSAYPSLRRCKQTNVRTLSEIRCSGRTCDTSVFTTDWELGASEYVIDTQTRFFINVPTGTESPAHFAPLDYSETAFITQFREPRPYNTPDGEVWRLYSRQTKVGDRSFEIIVGYAQKAPWKMVDTLQPEMGLVDSTLKAEADKMAAALPLGKGAVRGARVDGFEVVDAETQQVWEWGPWLPMFLPPKNDLPRMGSHVHVDNGDLYIAQIDTDGRVLATSFVPLGGLWWLALLAGFTFVSTCVIVRALSRRFLRGYFALMAVRVPALDEALRNGEGQTVEFKRGLSDDPTRTRNVEDELLKSIAAFANTSDGVIFLGVDDRGHVTGLDLDFTQKDRLEQKIRQLVRNRIRPVPSIQIGFEDMRGLVVAKITVARGEATAYMMGGVIYIRSGSSDVQAQPEDLTRLITEYAL